MVSTSSMPFIKEKQESISKLNDFSCQKGKSKLDIEFPLGLLCSFRKSLCQLGQTNFIFCVTDFFGLQSDLARWYCDSFFAIWRPVFHLNYRNLDNFYIKIFLGFLFSC